MGITYYLPNISGVTQYGVILAEELVKRNNKLTILTSRFKKNLKRTQIVNGVEVKRVDGITLGKGFLMPSYLKTAKKLVTENDIIIIHLPSIEGLALAFWAKIFRKKIITIHHCEFRFSGPISNKFIAIISFPFHFFTYLLSDIITIYTVDYAKTSFLLNQFMKKWKVVLPPIKIDRSLPALSLKRNNGEKLVGFAGRIAWEKGLEVLAEAMKYVKNARLVLAGPTEIIGGKKIPNNFQLLGPIPHEKIATFYKAIDVLVLPSTDNLETFGIVQAEAMKCGTPVVASNLPGVRMPVTLTRMGEIAKVRDAKDLAEKINLVLDNKEKYLKRAKNMESLDFQKTVDEYQKLFDNF